VFSFTSPALRWDRVPATLSGARRLLECAFAGERWREPGQPDVPLHAESIAVLRDLPAGPVLAWADTPATARAAVETLRAKKLEATLVGLRGCASEPEALAELGAPCVVTSLRPEDSLALLALPARLHEKGVAVAISTSAPDRSPTSLRLALSLAVAAGLPADAAVATVTSVPAKMLGLGARIGLVAPKYDADLVVFDGAPWEVRSRVLLVVAGGAVTFDRAAAKGDAR
jgi:imidazolonepropionase-like amidohydrolase